jgi:N-acetylmuramoyl-L-alanine amidase
MGTIYLTNLASWLANAGLDIVEYGGWQTRARGSGGYDAYPLCVMWHHTASPASWDGQKDADYCAVGDTDAPLANLYIDRSGTVWILAGGATNTNGKGNSIVFSRGTVPQDSMNTRALGVEMGNDGVGELWRQAQVDAMFVINNVCNQMFGNEPGDLSTHQFYAPDRKIDPATTNVEGPWRPTSSTSNDTWERACVQDEARARSGQLPPTPQPPEPQPPSEDDWMADLPTIKKGDSGPYVERMQHLLAAAGYMNEANTANYDGVWGDGTDSAKSRFDNDHGLVPSPPTDCGSKSWESLMTGRVW